MDREIKVVSALESVGIVRGKWSAGSPFRSPTSSSQRRPAPSISYWTSRINSNHPDGREKKPSECKASAWSRHGNFLFAAELWWFEQRNRKRLHQFDVFPGSQQFLQVGGQVAEQCAAISAINRLYPDAVRLFVQRFGKALSSIFWIKHYISVKHSISFISFIINLWCSFTGTESGWVGQNARPNLGPHLFLALGKPGLVSIFHGERSPSVLSVQSFANFPASEHYILRFRRQFLGSLGNLHPLQLTWWGMCRKFSKIPDEIIVTLSNHGWAP